MLSKHPHRPLLPHRQLGLPCSGAGPPHLFPHKTPLAQFPSLKSCPWTLSHTLNPALCNYSSSSCWKCDNTEKLRNLWHGTSEQPSSKEMVFLIFMLRLVTFSVILSQSKEKCSQGPSISNKHLLWLSSALLFALVFNYRTHVGHLLFASAATMNNIYYTDYHTTQCFPVYTHQRHISTRRADPSPAREPSAKVSCITDTDTTSTTAPGCAALLLWNESQLCQGAEIKGFGAFLRIFFSL